MQKTNDSMKETKDMARRIICGIYKITNTVNEKVYIGQSIDIYTRWTTHKNELRNNRHHNMYLQRAWNKHGEEKFCFDILEECSESLLNEKECYYIELLNSMDENYGYNLVSGGTSNKRFTEEVLKRMSNAQTGRVHSEETKKKISEAHKGKIVSEDVIMKLRESHKKENLSQETLIKMSLAKKGKSLSEEHRKKLAESRKNIIISEETRKKISESNMGHEVSQETREKLRKVHLGRKLSEESKEKVRKTRIKKAVVQLDKNNGSFICEYESITLAEEITGVPGTHISACCKGKRKSAKGFIWCYKEEYVIQQESQDDQQDSLLLCSNL
jgi:group I intron endonuclease